MRKFFLLITPGEKEAMTARERAFTFAAIIMFALAGFLFVMSSKAQQRKHSVGHKTVPPAILAITTTTLPAISLGVPYSTALAASGGIPPYTWALPCGSLPTGLSLSSAGVISGTATTPGSYAFAVTATDSDTKPSPYPATDSSVPIDCAALLAAPATITKNKPPGVFRVVVASK